MKSFLVIAFIYFIQVALAVDQQAGQCKSQTTCSGCVAFNPQCAWCTQDSFGESGKPRCDTVNTLLIQGCQQDSIVAPGNVLDDQKDINKELSKPGADLKNIVQLYPQNVKLKVRPHTPFDLEVKFRQAEDYPVDLYYLMDLSKSMEDDKDKLAELGNLLATSMSKITRNFQLGFGSFVDKVVMPYVSTVPEKLLAPCTGCAAPYGFKNHMKLTQKTQNFSVEVGKARVSGNLDAPEGGFDAIMQAIVCQSEIGWRNQSRKLLVFSTDSGFHYAGDGKLGGIVKPNDGLCHLDRAGYYTESVTQDYPSLSQLRHKVSDHKVNIIFAVTANQEPIYSELSSRLQGATTGTLANDSANVVDLVKEQYAKITSAVELQDDAKSNIKINYYSKCLGTQEVKTNICKGLKIGQTVSFRAQIEVTECPKDKKEWKQIFKIFPVGVADALLVELELMCECDCEAKNEDKRPSPQCGYNGTYECGVCSCFGKHYGMKCECDENHFGGHFGNDSSCKASDSTEICSSRGSCSCGICVCHTRPDPKEQFSGKYCECDNFQCDRVDEKLCNDRGKCECGKCKCDEGWGGNSCACEDSTSNCINPDDNDNKICSGKGTCSCNKCKCEDSKYSGQYCEECPFCKGRCTDLKDCVQCFAFFSGPLKDNCTCSNVNITLVEEAKVENKDEKICSFTDEDDCKFTFVYKYEREDYADVRVQITKECPTPVDILLIVLAVIGGIVLVGLCLLLIWKLLTTIHDRREFAKFEKERQMAKWDTGENPIFKQATSTFKNPTYGGKQ